MAKIYAELIRKGIKTIDNVPSNLRDAVQAILEELTSTVWWLWLV